MPERPKPEHTAHVLQERLLEFASLDMVAQHDRIADLMRWIQRDVTIEVIGQMRDPEFQAKLEEKIALVLETPLQSIFEKEPIVDAWKGPHTVVALTRKGQVKGGVYVPDERLTALGYPDLSGYALSKAVAHLHLMGSGFPAGEGVNDDRSYPWLMKKGLVPDRELFRGSGSGAVYRTIRDVDNVVYGASGCVANEGYISRVIKGIPGPETHAGDFNSGFIEILSYYMHAANRPVTTLSEPRAIENIRMGN